ncbi:MAG: hypothetical protein JSV09_07250 [Thermoplasmata archaeon]|nr:MAG: hypothetical protein JSV09_07250 [Thermoplasmata archaeon]
MNSKSGVLAALSIRPHKINELIDKLPYSKHTIYKALQFLFEEGLINKRQEKGKIVVEISKDYTTQKMREIYIKALSFGIDPEVLLRESTLTIWKQLLKPKTLKDLQKSTGFSYPWVRNIVKFLVDSKLAVYEKRKPMIAVLKKEHELNLLLEQYTRKKRPSKRLLYEGTIPFEKLTKTPSEIEKILYQKIDSSLAIKDTGFMIKSEDKLSVVESVESELTIEELFLREIKTTEGVEDFCIRLIAQGKLDYDKLLNLAKEKEMVNSVGCYLDVLNDIKKRVNSKIIKEFQKNVTKRKATFLKEERKYGKGGWEDKYEEKWNVDLFLDIGAIRHGVRSI